ncbi:MAG: haloalkane dehalogenase, partial [Nitrospinae bacterium]|nr:haloalkane dehalogenase [Nitrospinota bacterium]
NVIPHLESLGRCLAPDLMNSGASDNISGGGCRYRDHIPYLDAWFEAVGATQDAFFVLHDWGAALGFNRVARFPGQVVGLAYMESMVRPRLWTDMPEDRVAQFKTLRGEAGLQMVMEDNFFVETMLFDRGVVRDLSEAEKAVYRAPTEDPQKRRQTHQWACEIPFEGEPQDNYEIVKRYSDYLRASENLPKLFINCEYGHALAGAARDFCHQEEITIPTRHYGQEDCPGEIGRAVAAFIQKVRE